MVPPVLDECVGDWQQLTWPAGESSLFTRV
jgi:hypothetical protein